VKSHNITVPVKQLSVVAIAAPAVSVAALSTPLDWAIAYANFGLRVSPARANGDLLGNLRTGTRDPRTLASMWAIWPFADIALPIPPNIIAVIVDNRYRLLPQFGDSDAHSVETPSIATTTGGAALLFAASGGPYQAKVKIEDEETAAKFEVIAAGGHILLPSVGTGRTWVWPFSRTPLAPLPDWVEREAVEPTGDIFECLKRERQAKERARARRAKSSSGKTYGPIMIAARDVARALGCMKARGRKGYLCHCPGPNHRNGDRRPSLSVSNGDDGRLLLNCFGGCFYGEIIDALEQRRIIKTKGEAR
jgi:hypothetical protein